MKVLAVTGLQRKPALPDVKGVPADGGAGAQASPDAMSVRSPVTSAHKHARQPVPAR